MIKKEIKAIMSKAGNGGISTRVPIPAEWARILEIDAEHRELEIELTSSKEIIIRKKEITMSRDEKLKEFKNVVRELEEKFSGRRVNDFEIREEIRNNLSFLEDLFAREIKVGDIEENADYLRVSIKNNDYTDLIVGYENMKNDDCENTCIITYIDLD